jgi:hypothetical protein
VVAALAVILVGCAGAATAPASLRPLKLSVAPNQVPAGGQRCFRFGTTSSGHPVRGVTIRFVSRTAHTNRAGRARICTAIPKPGFPTARATRSGYRTAHAVVRASRGA